MDFIKTNLIYFWKIGKLVYEKRKVYDNIIERSSKYFSYYFGNSTYLLEIILSLWNYFILILQYITLS